MLAALILNRLRAAGCDHHIWHTQFAFRSGYGTIGALFAARRTIELSEAVKDKPLLLLALDWAKSFDCISHPTLVAALLRFGLPARLAIMIENIYSVRPFFVFECGVNSAA